MTFQAVRSSAKCDARRFRAKDWILGTKDDDPSFRMKCWVLRTQDRETHANLSVVGLLVDGRASQIGQREPAAYGGRSPHVECRGRLKTLAVQTLATPAHGWRRGARRFDQDPA